MKCLIHNRNVKDCKCSKEDMEEAVKCSEEYDALKEPEEKK